ncbi:hypothetical protein ABTE87_21330, partial [Acinetobacter baumannii]
TPAGAEGAVVPPADAAGGALSVPVPAQVRLYRREGRLSLLRTGIDLRIHGGAEGTGAATTSDAVALVVDQFSRPFLPALAPA